MPFTIPAIHLEQIDSTTLAYLAGIVDGEGSIVICKRRDRNSFSSHVTVQMCHPEAVNLLFRLFGGSRLPVDRQFRPNHNRQFKWEAASNQAAVVCEKLLPYLRIKKAQALNLIEAQKVNRLIRLAVNKQRALGNGFTGRRGAFPIDPALRARLEEIAELNHLLNKRGRL